MLHHAYHMEPCALPVTQVYNLTTYPHLVGLFETLGVETEPSDMSFALSVDGGALEWGSQGLGAVFARRSNLLRPSFWRMIYDVVRFGKACLEVGADRNILAGPPGPWQGQVLPLMLLLDPAQPACLAHSIPTSCRATFYCRTASALRAQVVRPENAARFEHVSLGEYLHSNGYSDAFIRNYILPMCAAVWSMPSSKVTSGPVRFSVLLTPRANAHVLRPPFQPHSYNRPILGSLPLARCPVL